MAVRLFCLLSFCVVLGLMVDARSVRAAPDTESSSRQESAFGFRPSEPAGAWAPDFAPPGISGAIACLASFGGDLVVGGDLQSADGLAVVGIARWDGSVWRAMVGDDGSGPAGRVDVLHVHDGALHAGGTFRLGDGEVAVGVARWDGNSWRLLGTPRRVTALVSFGGDLVASAVARLVYRWNGSEWIQLGERFDERVLALAVHAGELYAGGSFTQVGGAEVGPLARWDGGAWRSVMAADREGYDPPSVSAIASFQGDLVVSGSFEAVDGAPAYHYARWDGVSWAPLGAHLFAAAHALLPDGDRLVVLALYNPFLLVWDGRAWSSIGGRFLTGLRSSTSIDAVAIHDGGLTCAGSFDRSSERFLGHVAQWDGDAWQPVGTIRGGGLGGKVTALFADETGLYVGGTFATAGTTVAHRVAHRVDDTWRSLGADPAGEVTAIARLGGELFVGTSTHDLGVDGNVTRFDGASWQELPRLPLTPGDPLRTSVLAFTPHDGSMVAAATSFDVHVDRSCVARWNGSAWERLGPEFDVAIHGLAVHDGSLVAVGGREGSDSYVAVWNGTAWERLPSLEDAIRSPMAVFAATVHEGTLFVGGGFSGEPFGLGFVARWDGERWHRVGAEFSRPVWALAVSQGQLVAAGEFGGTHTRGGLRSVAVWDEALGWSPLDGGVGNGTEEGPWVGAFAATSWGDRLVVGGAFRGAGDAPSQNLAIWKGTPPDVPPPQPSPPSSSGIGAIAPNPINERTTIECLVPSGMSFRLSLYDALGRELGSLDDEGPSSGRRIVAWNELVGARDLPSGRYWVHLRSRSLAAAGSKTLVVVP